MKGVPTLYSLCGTQLELNPQFNPRVLEREESEHGKMIAWTQVPRLNVLELFEHRKIRLIESNAKCRH